LPSKQVSLILFLIIFKYIALIIVCDRHSAITYYNFDNNKGNQILYMVLKVVQITGIIK
jgi:hypothetical protein